MVRLSVLRLTLLVCLHLLCLGNVVFAQQFPYQAVVVKDQAEVRCGPSAKLYVTSYARLNEEIVVHRHDHGGWYMISPPSDSFSLVEKRLIDRTDSQRGMVNLSPGSGNVPRAIAYIGSIVTDEATCYGRELNHGDQVTILGEQLLQTRNGALEMYKIQAPAQEFRWIKGEAVIPRNQAVQQQMAADPYQVPPQHRQRLASEGRGLLVAAVTEDKGIQQVAHEAEFQTVHADSLQSRGGLPNALPPMRTGDAEFLAPSSRTAMAESSKANGLSDVRSSQSASKTVSSAKPSQRGPNPDYVRLHDIDREFEQILKLDPKQWNFDQVVADYRALGERASPNLKILVAERLENAEKRKKISEHYQRFIQISAETAARDQNLVIQQSGQQMGMQTQYGAASAQFSGPHGEMITQAGDHNMMAANGQMWQQNQAEEMSYQTADGQMIQGQVMQGQLPQGQMMPGQMTPVQMQPVQMQTAQLPQGHLPQEQFQEGQFQNSPYQTTNYQPSPYSGDNQFFPGSQPSMNAGMTPGMAPGMTPTQGFPQSAPFPASQLQPTLGMQPNSGMQRGGPPLMAPEPGLSNPGQGFSPTMAAASGPERLPTAQVSPLPPLASSGSQNLPSIQQTSMIAGVELSPPEGPVSAVGQQVGGGLVGGPEKPAGSTASSPASKYAGAGVLHEMQGPPEFPKFCLVAKDGRLLAFVTPPPGVNMDEYLGREVGLVGTRSQEVALGGDHIKSTQVEFVQLSR